jgi:hypothetical protein
MYDFTLNTGMMLILGRYNKKKSNVLLSWYRKPNKEYHPSFENKSRIFPEISNEFKIESFFKLIITPEIVQEIADNTNIRIKLIDCTHMNNDKYKKQKERQFKNLVSTNEIYAFIGVLLLLGITKNHTFRLMNYGVKINELWSLHFAEFAAAAFSRERFQLIAQNITFDSISNSV